MSVSPVIIYESSMPLNFYWMTLSENKSFTDKGIYLKILCMSSIFTKSFLILLKAVKAARGGKYVHRELIGTVTDKKGKIRNKWKYFYNQGTLQQELAAWKAEFERKQAKQKRNLFATPADIKGVSNVDKILAEHPNLRTATITPKVRHTIQDVTPEGYGPDELPKQTSVATPQPTSPKVEPVQTVSFDDHIASQNLTPKQLEVSKQVYNTVKDLPESELRVRLDRLSKLPASNGIAGITAINYVLGLTRSEAMLGNQNAAGRHNVESRTIPELNEVLASTSDKDYMANVITQIETNRILPMTIDNLKSAIAALPVKDSSIIEKLVRSMITQNQVNYNKTVIPNPISDKFREEQLKKNNEALSNKFNSLADAMEKTIDSKINSAIGQQRTTARRARIAGGMYEEGQNLKRIQAMLRGMAMAIKNNDLPQELQNIKSRTDLEILYNAARSQSDYYLSPWINTWTAKDALKEVKGLTKEEKNFLERRASSSESSQQLRDENNIRLYESVLAKARKQQVLRSNNKGEQALRIRALGIRGKEQLEKIKEILEGLQHGYTAPDPKAKKIKDLETKLIGQKIPDFFPTPKRVIQDMISRADIQPGMKVLEPSAGKGDIADALKEAGAEVDTIEPVYSLSDILKEKGHNVLDTQDFLEHKEQYDRIVMNPPFGRGADMKHVRHAYDLLKPGGKLVAIMGEGGFFRSDNQSKEFREWLDSVNSDVEKLPEGSFRGVDSFVQTGANTRMVTITKPVENNFETMPDSKPQENNFDTMPETKQEEKSAVPTGVKIESNGNSQVVKSSSVNPDTKEIIYTVENRDGIETKVPESKVKILPVTQTTEVKKVIESAEPSNRMSIEKQLIGKPENVTSIKDDIAEKSKAPIAYIEKEITTLSGIKIKAIDYSSVPINEIQIIDAENILTTPKPSYIPEINERDFEIKSYFLEFVKAPDGNFIVPLNRYVPKVQRALERDAKGNIAYQNKAREQEPKYAIMSLENIVATTEYYRTKKLEEGRDKATKNNIANVEKILTWDQKTREYYKPFNYTRLSESQKKKYSEEAWNKLSETEKLKEVPKMKNPPIYINPIPRLKIGLKEMSMLVSTFHLYNELVDSSYSIPSRAAGYNPKDQVAIDFNSIREDYKQKVEDMKIQKEEDSASYKQALETSFGMSKTKNDLFESHGILVKSQNGKEVNRDQVKDISEAMNLVYSVFGDKKQLSQSANLKISHSGEKYIFASKALGMYVRSMGTIAISNKDSKVSKGFTLAHEFAHFMDNWLGKKNKRNFASDDYNSVAGKIAKTFREKMENLDIATGYHKRTCECFARALEQYFAIKTGNDSEYSNQKYYIKDTKYFEETFSPMIEKFLSENEHLLKAFPLFTERKSNILTLLKGKKAQEGEVRTWGNNKQYKKVGGKWQPVNEGKKKAEPKQKKEKKKGSAESNTGFSMKPFAEIKRIAQYTKEADFDKEKIEQYKNSIAEHGYDPAFPMVIDKDKKTGAYNVVAGNHRYKAVEALINEGKLPKDFEIPTVMREFEDENARLAYQVRENQRRDPLPTDEANAYKKMADNGWDAARIAKELGQPVGKITKRLALSNLSPDLFNLVSKKGIPVGIAEAIGLGSVEEESGKPNHTIQLKAYQFYRDNKGKGYGAGEVLSFIRELKSNASQKFFENDGKSDTEKEALRNVGSEEKAKRNVKMLDNTFKTMQKALSNLMGDSVGQINPKLAKELSASIVAAQGESEFSNKMKMLDTVIQDMTIMKEAFLKSFKGIKDDSTMGMMFASAINSMIHEVNKHTKAIETAKGINKMLSLAYKAKYKLHDQSVKARLAA